MLDWAGIVYVCAGKRERVQNLLIKLDVYVSLIAIPTSKLPQKRNWMEMNQLVVIRGILIPFTFPCSQLDFH